MSDRAGLVAAILNDPADDTPRLIFADYLQENGEIERAEFIRLQCAGEKEQAAKVLAEHGEAWRAALGVLNHVGVFQRGFLTEVWIYAGEFAGHAAALLSIEPATIVLGLDSRVDDSGIDARLAWVDQLAANSHLKAVTRIYSQNGDWGPKRFARLMRSPHLGNLTELLFTEDVIGLAGVKAVVEAPSAFALTMLDLNSAIQHDGAEETRSVLEAVKLIASSPRFASLKHLGLTFNSLGNRSVEALLASTTLSRSLHLEIEDNKFDDEYFERLEERFGNESDGGDD